MLTSFRSIFSFGFIPAVLICWGWSVALAADAGRPMGWRNDGTGQFENCQPPTSWSPSNNVLWKCNLPGQSFSSPIVVGDRIFVMSEPTDLVCTSAADGSILWKKSHQYSDIFPADRVQEIDSQHAAAKKVQAHIDQLQKQLADARTRNAPMAELQQFEAQIAAEQKKYDTLTPYPPIPNDGAGNTTGTPVSDGQVVWAAVATGIVSAHDLDGKRLWIQYIEKPGGRHTSSPLWIDGRVVIHFKNLVALDPKDGTVLWRKQSPARTGTAAAMTLGNTALIITPAGEVIRSTDGERLADHLFDMSYASPIVDGDRVFGIERGRMKSYQMVQGGNGKVEAKLLWETPCAEDDRLASPVLHQDLLYTITGKGILEVAEAATGQRVYRKRLDFNDARADSSLAIAGDILFVSSNQGRTWLLRPGREYEEISRNELEGTSSSPFFHSSFAYIRTPKSLYCLGK